MDSPLFLIVVLILGIPVILYAWPRFKEDWKKFKEEQGKNR